MSRIVKHLLTALSALLIPVSLAFAAFPVTWMESDSTENALFVDALKQSGVVQDAAGLSSVPVAWPERLHIIAGGGGLPRYDVALQAIHIPADYLATAVRAQDQFEESRSEALKAGMDVVEYTLYHLLGHALYGGYDEAEDARAEAAATWLMVTSFPNGGEQWLENLRAFGRASQKLDGPLTDYWHKHALYRIREKQLNCLVFGSDIAHFATLYPGLKENQSDAEACVQSWQQLDQSIKNP